VDASGESRLEAAQSLLGRLVGVDVGGAQVGPLVVVRTPEALVCGVLALAELRKDVNATPLAEPIAVAERLRRLPEGRFCDLSDGPRGAKGRAPSR
jgi:hypothetical protein